MEIRVLVGMIGSGKSEYARSMSARGQYVVVCHDTLSAMLDGDHGRYDSVNRKFYQSAERMLVSWALDTGQNVIIDRTNLTRKSRARWIGLAQAHGADVTAAVFGFDKVEVHAKRRFKHDPRGLSLEEWTRIAREMAVASYDQPVTFDEGFKDIFRIDENTDPNFYGYLLHEAINKTSGPN